MVFGYGWMDFQGDIRPPKWKPCLSGLLLCCVVDIPGWAARTVRAADCLSMVFPRWVCWSQRIWGGGSERPCLSDMKSYPFRLVAQVLSRKILFRCPRESAS